MGVRECITNNSARFQQKFFSKRLTCDFVPFPLPLRDEGVEMKQRRNENGEKMRNRQFNHTHFKIDFNPMATYRIYSVLAIKEGETGTNEENIGTLQNGHTINNLITFS